MSHTQVLARRESISRLMAKSVTRPEDISKSLKIEITTVYADLKYFKKESEKWLYGFANEGYVFVTKQTIDSLYDIEVDLQQMRQQATTPEEKLKIIRELRETINTRWVIQGEGPTLMALQKKNDSKTTS